MEIVILIVYVAILVVVIAGVWKTFEKAGQPGWAAIVPIYNIYVMTQIAKKPGWWLVLFLVPIVSIIIAIILMIEIAKQFGKDTGFGLGLAFLGFIFFPILGFGDAKYIGGESASSDEILDDM
ncbi:MAG: DUF5684 domain-containing protein [Putridiphycobacter sp.]